MFIIEKKGNDEEYQEKSDHLDAKRSNLNESKLRKIASGYKLYDKLNSTSKIPAVNSKSAFKEKRKTIYNDDCKLTKFWNDKKVLIENAKKLKAKNKKLNEDPKLRFEMYDLWNDNRVEKSADSDIDLDYTKTITEKPVIKVPDHLRQKPSLLPAVEVPYEGQSYNPDQNEYQELLVKAATKEVEKLNEETYWTNKVEKYFVPKEQANNELAWIEEMSQGLGLENEDVDEHNSVDSDNEEIVKFSKQIKNNNKKTKSQRRKELKEKFEKIEKEKERSLKLKENEIFKIKTIKKELNEREKRLAERAKKREQKHIESLYKPKRLTRHRFEEADIELNLPNEISGSLRKTKVEGNLLVDRFKSLQKRNIIETRVRQVRKRKYKLKKEIKRRHKSEQ